MIKFIIVIVVVVFGRWLEMLERENSYIFGCVSLLLAITFTSFDHVRFERTPTVIEKNLSSVLVINSGGEIPNRASGSVILQTGSGKSKKFNIKDLRRFLTEIKKTCKIEATSVWPSVHPLFQKREQEKQHRP